ncbi:MAG TPA: polyphosphate kinase 2 [Miltoncostaeaceae bacterium]|nr:polyphosphate kinase 2 [Miltoncostaeaceae bacterium]
MAPDAVQPPTDLRTMEREPPYPERMRRRAYEEELLGLQIELVKLQAWTHATGQRIAILFEGRDAAGKGGAIKRLTEHLNPRMTRVVALAKPNETETGQWYFQRYISHLPTRGEIVLFDRSWYNRAGVERVMGFSTPVEYGEFLRQAPELERNLVDAGLHLFKLWFTVSREEQARRFEARRSDPLKVWKLSPMDEAALTRFDDYSAARDAMLVATDSAAAPWTVVNSNDKRRARLEAIRHVLGSFDYAHRDDAVARPADPRVVRPAAMLLGARGGV